MMSSKYERKQRRRQQKRSRQEQQSQEKSAPAAPTMPLGPVKAPQEDENRQNTAESADRQDSGKRKSAWPRRRMLVIAEIVFSGFIALFTGLQVYYGNKQWDATEKQYSAMLAQNAITQGQLDLARRAGEQAQLTLQMLQHEERPWLAIEDVHLERLDVGESPAVVLYIANSGKLPGTVLDMGFEGEIDERTEAFIGDVFAEHSGKAIYNLRGVTIPPNERQRVEVKSLPTMTAEMLNDIEQLRQAVYIMAYIYYDGPGKERAPREHVQGDFNTHCMGRYEPSEGRIDLHYNRME